MGELLNLRAALVAVRACAFGLAPSLTLTSSRLTPHCAVGHFHLERINMTTSSNINHSLLVADIRAISGQIRGLKQQLRVTWRRPMQDEQRELERLKLRATQLCALRAFTRGRLHVQRPPRGAPSTWNALAYHRCIVERLGPSYAIALEQSA